ncbi:MAG TPA: protease complex subunit PrcB family protein [Gemmatimonadaceae bacterium]
MSVARLASLILLTACSSAIPAGHSTAQSVPVPLVRLRDGAVAFSMYTGVGDSLRAVVRDSSRWRQLWDRINQPFYPRPALPPIDFRREMIVVAGLGARPSAGYDVVIETVEQDSTGIEVGLRRASPAPGCPVAAVTTQPLDIARIPASGQPVRFRERTVVVPCGSP